MGFGALLPYTHQAGGYQDLVHVGLVATRDDEISMDVILVDS